MLGSVAAATALTAFAPVLVHDAGERHPLAAVGPPGTPATAYARAAPATEGGTWLQYWLYFRENTQDRGIVRTGRHAGDWEMVQIRLDPAGRPVEAVFAQHAVAERCAWPQVRRDASSGRPLVYIANGSHAAYPRPGTRDRTWPDPNDEADGRGTVTRPRVVRISATSPAWMRDPEPWGAARKAWWNPAEQSSPVGPAFQGQGRWSDPDGWAAAARPCAPGCDRVGACDGTETALAAGGLAAALVGGGGLIAWRRRRATRCRSGDRSGA